MEVQLDIVERLVSFGKNGWSSKGPEHNPHTNTCFYYSAYVTSACLTRPVIGHAAVVLHFLLWVSGNFAWDSQGDYFREILIDSLTATGECLYSRHAAGQSQTHRWAGSCYTFTVKFMKLQTMKILNCIVNILYHYMAKTLKRYCIYNRYRILN